MSPLEPLPSAMTVPYIDRLRRTIQDGQTSTGEVLSQVRLEDLSDQVQQQATPTAQEFAVRFAATPTSGIIATFVVPLTLICFVDASPAPITPEVDVNSSGVFKLHVPPTERLQVTYSWMYLQNGALEEYLNSAAEWLGGTVEYPLGEEPAGLTPALISYAANKALAALAAKLRIASMRAGEASTDFSDLTKAWSAQAKAKYEDACAARKSYYERADQRLAPVSESEGFKISQYQPRR